MKKVLIVVIILVFSNCNTNKYRDNLIGDWYMVKNPNSTLHFSKDSLLIRSIFIHKHTWKANRSNIYFENGTDIYLNKVDEKDFRNHFHYSLSLNNDTLLLSTVKEITTSIFKYIRIKDKYEHFKKTIGLDINLPKIKEALLPINQKYNYINIYIDSKDGRLRLKNNDKYMLLKHLKSEVYRERLQLDEKEFQNNFIFNMIADENVTDAQMDSIIIILKEAGINRVFRVYRNDTIDYKDNLDWHGLLIPVTKSSDFEH